MRELKSINNKIGKSILNSEIKEILINATGISLDECFSKVFDKLKVIVYNESNNLLIQMDTQDIILKKCETKERAIKISKNKLTFEIEVLVKVNVKYIEMEGE